MKLHIILDESGFFLPEYLCYIATHLPKNITITGVTVLQNPPTVPSLYTHVKANWWRIGFRSCFCLGRKVANQHRRTLLQLLGVDVQPGSVFRTCRQLGLPHRRIKKVNSADSLDWISAGDPDVILSSCSQIFKGALLDLPKICSINRHSGLLPSYGGLFPIFQSLSANETQVGSTIHIMSEQIDKGPIIAQKSFEVHSEMTLYECYEQSYQDCGPLTIEALAKISHTTKDSLHTTDFGIQNNYKSSYHSFPTAADWKKFKITGIRFC